MQFFTSDPIQFQETIALLLHIKISLCSMSCAGNAATSEKLAVSYCLTLWMPWVLLATSDTGGGGGGGDWHELPLSDNSLALKA